MALRREDLTSEQRARQEALDRSWASAQRELADPVCRAFLEAAIRRLDTGEPVPEDLDAAYRARPRGVLPPQRAAGVGTVVREEREPAVALRREDLTPEQRAHQEALDRSWASAQRELADPVVRARLEAAIRELDAKDPPPPVLTREEFLAQTAYMDE